MPASVAPLRPCLPHWPDRSVVHTAPQEARTAGQLGGGRARMSFWWQDWFLCLFCLGEMAGNRFSGDPNRGPCRLHIRAACSSFNRVTTFTFPAVPSYDIAMWSSRLEDG